VCVGADVSLLVVGGGPLDAQQLVVARLHLVAATATIAAAAVRTCAGRLRRAHDVIWRWETGVGGTTRRAGRFARVEGFCSGRLCDARASVCGAGRDWPSIAKVAFW
jgi:hypothetical protein